MKKIFWTVGLMLLGIIVYNVSTSFFIEFQNLSVEGLKQRFSEVHFVGGGNNFGGAIFWLDAKSLPPGNPQIIEYGTGSNYVKKACTTMVRGLYYNNQRGMRMRPLDTYTLTMLRKGNPISYNKLSLTGGFFRDCKALSGGANESYTIYGAITYTLTGGSGGTTLSSSLAAGTKLSLTGNAMIAGTAENFQYFNNVTPIGYFYDSYGGIAFVGGSLTGHNQLVTFLNSGGNTINDAFMISGITIVSTQPGNWSFFSLSGINTAQDTLWNMLIKGAVGVSRAIDPGQRTSLLGNPEKRTIILGGSEINSSTIMDFARRNAQNLCRGKTLLTDGTRLPTDSSDTVLCYAPGVSLAIALWDHANDYRNKTIILSNGNLYLSQTVYYNTETPIDTPFEVFIDGGNLYLDNDVSSHYRQFNANGYPDFSANGFLAGMYLKGNFIVNGLILGGVKFDTTPKKIDHKLHIEGRVVSLNTPTEPTQGRINQVTNLLGAGYDDYISLQNTFTWACGFDGTGSDGTFCGSGNTVSLVPLVILNGNFAGNLLR